jgi:hypothetical protein
MSVELQKTYVEKIKRCQRNWDQTFVIPKEHVDHFVYLATNSPTKQYEAYFNLYVLSNKELLEDLCNHTWGFTYNINDDTSTAEVPCCLRNPQMNANIYFLWTTKNPNTIRNYERDGKEKNNIHPNRKDNALTSIGISMGIVAYSAASLGYSTGFNKNHARPGYEGYWNRKLNISDDEEITYGLGIGIPKLQYQWNESDEHKMMLGWPNPQIIDINSTDKYTYNNKEYTMRKEIKYPSFSSKPRDIQVKRFE